MRLPSQPFTLSYSLSRPFPFRGFTWIVIIGGTILTVLFTFVAVAGNAYQFKTVYSSNPNATVDDKYWFQKPPLSWVNDQDATCQEALLTAGGRYITTNQGFIYTLDRLWRPGLYAGTSNVLSQAAYYNSVLEKCDVSQIAINLGRLDNARQSGYAWTWGATTAHATTTCTVNTPSGPVKANFTLDLPRTLESKQIQNTFLSQNSSGYSSMWYGAQLTSQWYDQIGRAMAYSAPASNFAATDAWGEGTIKLFRNPAVTDYRDAAFFNLDFQISTQRDSALAWLAPPKTVKDWQADGRGLPNVSITVDAFGKTLYSLLASDFGNGDPGNALLSHDGIQYLQSINDTVASKAAALTCKRNYCDAGTIDRVIADSRVVLNTTRPATLVAQYLCSVPRQKGGFSLFVGVLIADIVFLNACWTLFRKSATLMVERRDEQANYCPGCIAGEQDRDISGEIVGDSGRISGNYKLREVSQLSVEEADGDNVSTRTMRQPLL